MELKTHLQVTEHLRDLREALQKRHGWNLERFVTETRVPKQTFKQYCMLPDKRGARRAPAWVLECLRSAVIELDRARWDKFFPTYLGREEKSWFVLNSDMSTCLETHSLFAAVMYAARNGSLSVVPGPDNANPDEQLSEKDQLCVDWIQVVESGFVSRQDVMDVTGVSEYEVDLVGCEQLNWRIQPALTQVLELRRRARQTWEDRHGQAA